MAPAASCPTPRWHARYGYAKRTTPWTSHDWSSTRPHGSARTPANDDDGSPWHAPSSNGSPTGSPSAEFQVYSHSKESSSSGYAWTNVRPQQSFKYTPTARNPP